MVPGVKADATEAAGEKTDELDEGKPLTVIFKVPQEKVPNLTLVFTREEVYSLTIEQIKKMIHAQHPYKPTLTNQRLLFGGRLLQNTDKLCTVVNADATGAAMVWGATKTFHLMILQKYEDMKESIEKKAAESRREARGISSSNDIGGSARTRHARRPRANMTNDQVYMTENFQKFEKKLLREYLKTLQDVKTKNQNIDRGSHNGQSRTGGMGQNMNTNVPLKESLLLSNLPIMHHKFQERLNTHVT